jgi:hypothetical protein
LFFKGAIKKAELSKLTVSGLDPQVVCRSKQQTIRGYYNRQVIPYACEAEDASDFLFNICQLVKALSHFS